MQLTLIEPGELRQPLRDGRPLAIEQPSSGGAEDVRLEFGRFRVLLRQRQLLADRRPLELGTRAFDVLMVLIEADGSLVTKDELLNRVWPGIVVAPDNLKVQISALRKALGGSRDFIRTEFGRGYRFTAVVRRTTTADPGFFSTPDATETPAGWKGIPPIELSAIAARVASLERKLAEALELLNGRSDSDAADLLRHHRCSGFSSGANRQHMFSKRAKPGNMSLFTRNG